MLIDKEIRKIFNQLDDGMPLRIPFEGSEIFVNFIDNATKLCLTSQVYFGGNYIPSSVRRCLSLKTPPFYGYSIPTFLSVDEHRFQINLNYLGETEDLSYADFKDLIGEFSAMAEQWRLYLDEHDRNDLVYVRVPK